MEETKKPLIIVLSRSYSTGLGVIRALGKEGYKIDLIESVAKDDPESIAAKSKYVNRYVQVKSRKIEFREGDPDLISEIMKYSEGYEEKPVIFPADDYTTTIVGMHIEELSNYFHLPHVVSEEPSNTDIIKIMDKTYQSEQAVSVGLEIPKEWIVDLEEEIVEVSQDIVYPCFVKPIMSSLGYKREMIRCDDAESLLVHLEKMKAKFPYRKVLIQEYLEIDREITVLGSAFDQRVVIPAVTEMTSSVFREIGGLQTGVLLPFDILGEKVCEQVASLVKRMRFVGNFGLDINIVKDRILFSEINFRTSGYNFALCKNNINLPLMFVEYLTEIEPIYKDVELKNSKSTFVYDKLVWEDYAFGHLSKEEAEKIIASVDTTLLHDEEDSEPGKLMIEKNAKTLEERERNKKKNAKARIRQLLRKYIGPARHKLLGYPQTKKKNRRDSVSKAPRVLVSGRNYCSNLSIAKSLGEAGYEVEVLRVFRRRPEKNNILRTLRPEVYSKYVKAYYSVTTGKENQKIIDRMIELSDKNNKMLLIPADDLVAYVVDENYNILQEYYHLPSINDESGGIVRMMDKSIQKKYAEDAGFSVLNSCTISSSDSELSIPNTVKYPCFIKPKISKNSSKSQMKKCDSYKDLIETINERRGRTFELLVEDYVEISRELSFLGLSTPDGVICPGYFEAVIGGEGKHRGVAMLGRMLPTEEAGDLVEKAVELIKSIEYIGLFGIDLIETKDGRIFFAEINLRYGASGYALTKCGCNLPAMFADYILKGEKIDSEKNNVINSVTFASEKVLLDEYIEGIIECSEAKKIMQEADVSFIKDRKDKNPYRHMKLHRLRAERLRQRNIQKEKERQKEAQTTNREEGRR